MTDETSNPKIEYLVAHEFNPVGDQVVAECWYLNGELSRSNGPALTTWHELTGQKLTEQWYINGRLHRREGPAVIEYSIENAGAKEYEAWLVNGSYYRIGKPSRVWHQLDS